MLLKHALGRKNHHISIIVSELAQTPETSVGKKLNEGKPYKACRFSFKLERGMNILNGWDF